jgi:hypothetical protein
MRLGAKPEKVETLQLILPTVQPENFITSTTTIYIQGFEIKQKKIF